MFIHSNPLRIPIGSLAGGAYESLDGLSPVRYSDTLLVKAVMSASRALAHVVHVPTFSCLHSVTCMSEAVNVYE